MQVIAALTFWGLFAAFLIFPIAGLPRRLQHAAGTLIAAEAVALMLWGFADPDCDERPCSTVSEVGYTAAKIDVPLLAVALVALAVAVGVRDKGRRQGRSGGQRQRTTRVRGPL